MCCFCFDPRSDLNYPHTHAPSPLSRQSTLFTPSPPNHRIEHLNVHRLNDNNNPHLFFQSETLSTLYFDKSTHITLIPPEMPPKKSTTAAKKDPEHPSYKDMITSAISTVFSLSQLRFCINGPLHAIPTHVNASHFCTCHLFLIYFANIVRSSKNVMVPPVKLSRNTFKATTK